nr:hypothetical protein [uncultured Blautia sp.]
MKRYKLLLFIGIIFAFAFTITGCGNKSEEDAFEDDMEPLDSDELADMDIMGDDEVQSVDDSQVSDEERQAAEELEKNAAESGALNDEGVTEDEIDKEVQQELEDAGLTDGQQ